jgi:hypothetical protein
MCDYSSELALPAGLVPVSLDRTSGRTPTLAGSPHRSSCDRTTPRPCNKVSLGARDPATNQTLTDQGSSHDLAASPASSTRHR